MALAEQPLKKRKLHEAVIDPHSYQQSFVSPLSQDEILRKQRNKAEIRSLYDCYRRIKYCISKKDARLMPEFEQAYLALITASRGCTSAHRILAELIPRYASHCPTALEAAAKVSVNMYNWNFATIVRGDDLDGVAFQTAKACVFGLVDICCTASSEAPTSSVIRGICSAVFLNVLTFFLSSFEGHDIYQIGDEDIVKIQGSSELFLELKQKVAGEGESTLSKLFKFRVLSLLRIFFCCPRNLFEACFELFKSSSAGVGSLEGGNYFLRQVTSQISSAGSTSVGKMAGEATATGSAETCKEGAERVTSDENKSTEDTSLVLKNCLVGVALTKDPSLRHWLFLKYKKLSKLLCSQAASDISSAFEGIFKSFTELVKEVDSQEESDEDNPKNTERKYLIPRVHENPKNFFDKDRTPTKLNASTGEALHMGRVFDDTFSGQTKNISNLERHPELGNRSLVTGDRGDSYRDMQHLKNSFLSPVNKTPLNNRNDLVEGGNHPFRVENQIAIDFNSPTMRSTSGGVSNVLTSPEHLSSSHYHSSNQTVWYFDGDSVSMDVFSASKQLWLGSLGPNTSENGIKLQVEKFGPIHQFLFFPLKGFALVEYINIMDAIKAREYLRRSSSWGPHLQVKFLDVGLGSRGSINGVAVGSSCHVYVGSVSSQWIKDEILHEVTRVGFRAPVVFDLPSESALLMKFDTAEDAAAVMAHLRKHRKENGYHISIKRNMTSKEGMSDLSRSHMDGGRYIRTPIGTEIRNNASVKVRNSMMGSPQVPTVLDSPIDNCNVMMSQLSSLLLSLSSKYNISRNFHATLTKDDDGLPTNTLRISLPHIGSTFLTDDELMAVCSHAVGNVGSVVRLTRDNMQMNSCWFIELTSVDAAITVLKNLRSCPGMFFHINFSQPGKDCSTPVMNRSEAGSHELISPRTDSENRGNTFRGGHTLPMNWTSVGCTQMMKDGAGNYSKIDGPNSNIVSNFTQASNTVSHISGQMWTYNKPETELQYQVAGNMQTPPVAAHGPPVGPPQQNQASTFMRPVYVGPHRSWDGYALNNPLPPNSITANIRPNSFHVNVGVAPFIPPSVTPLAHFSGTTMPAVLSLSSIPPPNLGHQLPPSPPPLPMSQPPLVPPPPSSPPPVQSFIEPSNLEKPGQDLLYRWQGVLCKSGVNYCTVSAHREETDICKYADAISEPAGWPAKLDVTKRTDFQHVKSTFTSTPPHMREVCRLLPSTSGDQKGFQDFISYLKQRECAGVIKIPAGKSMWGRLLFLLPHANDTCSMLAIAPHPSDCLIALVLPKESNFEWVKKHELVSRK